MPGQPLADADADADMGRSAPVYSVVVPTRGLGALAIAAIATFAGLTIVDQGGTVFALLASAVTVAVLATPAVRGLGRVMPRGAAVAIATVVGIVGVVALLGTVAWDLNRQTNELSATLHEAIDRLPAGSTAAQTADSLGLSDRVDSVLDGAAARIVIGDTDPIAVAGQVGQFILIAVLGAFVLTQGRQVLTSALGHVRRASTREHIHRITGTGIARGGAFVRRTVVLSAGHALLAGIVATLLDVPGAIALGGWVLVVSTIPVLGGIFAWAPIVALASVGDVPLPIVLAVAVAAIVGHAIVRHRWVDRALHVGPFVTLLGLGIGQALAGVQGAVAGLLVAGILAAILAPTTDGVAAAVTDLVEDPEPHPDLAGTASPALLERTEVVAESRESASVLRLRLSGRSMAAGAALAVAIWTVFRIGDASQSIIIWLSIGAFIAVGLDRPISSLHRRWHVPRVAGIAIVLGLMVAVVAAVGVLGGPSISDSTTSIVDDAPETVRSLESLPIVGRLLREHDASSQIEDWIATLPDRIRDSDVLDHVVATAGDGLIGAMWTVSLLLALLLDGPRLIGAVGARIQVRSRMKWNRFGRAAYRALSNVAAASAFVAALNGAVVMMIALALGIPLAPVLGLWAIGWNFIPQIGGFVAAVPLVALGFGQGTTAGLIAFGVFITYQTFENHVIQPFVGSRAVRLPPLLMLVGALLLGSLAGFVGALMAGPILGVAKVALDELRDGPTVRVEDRRSTTLGRMLHRRAADV